MGWNAFFVCGALRYVCVLHFTWCVNSAAHLYGDHPYDVMSYPAENPFVYAASEFGISSQFNPSKLLIDIFAALGLVWGRKRGTAAWQLGRTRRIRDKANGVPLSVPAPRPWEVTAEGGKKME